MTLKNTFKYFKTSPKIIRLVVMDYIRYPLSFRQVEDILHERGVDICHETVRFWVGRFGAKFAKEIRKKRAGQHSNWQWHLDEVFVKINGERFYLWRAVDHEGEVLECFVTKRRNKAAAKKFLIKTMRKHGSPKIITTDKLGSYGAALREIGVVGSSAYVAADPTTYVKIHICHFDDEKGRCSVSRRLRHFRNLSVITVKSITTSTMKDIYKAGNPSSKNVQLLSQSGSISVPHDD
jgi:putative transposase